MAKRGRPKKPDALTEYFAVRFTPEQRERISAAGTADQWRFWMLEVAAKISEENTLPHWTPTDPDKPAKAGNT